MGKGKTATKSNIYRTQSQALKHLTKNEFLALRELCRLSKNLYNVGLYNVRQHYFNEKEFLNYKANYPHCKDNKNYKMLNSNMAQQILKEVDGAFKSFFALIKLAKSGSYDFRSIKLPHYLKKDGYYPLVIGFIRIKDNHILDVPMSPIFKKIYGKVSIKVPLNLNLNAIKEIKILPKNNARHFEVQYTYEIEPSQVILDKNRTLAVDLGLDNLCTCTTNEGRAFIIDGKKLKSINQFANKENARLQSIKDKQRIIKTTKRQQKLWNKRNNKVKDYTNKTCRYIINYCLKNNIGNLVIGYNPTLQKNINLGKANNQNFVNIPVGNIKEKLEYLCKEYNINFKKQEESYTSKADFLASDSIPTFNAMKPVEYSFSGKRITRGQYKSSIGITFNADVNGSLNIMRKSEVCDIDLKYKDYLNPIRVIIA